MAVVSGAFISWAVWFYSPVHAPVSSRQDLSPPELAIPEDKVIKKLDTGVMLMDNPPEPEHVTGINFSFLPRPEVVPREYIPLRVDLILIGKDEKFAAVNNRIYQEGELMPGGEKILSINQDGVLVLSPSTGRRFLPWEQKRAVKLQK